MSRSFKKGSEMETGTLNVGGNLFRIVSLDEGKDSSVLEMVIPPVDGPNYQNTPHRHPSSEQVSVITGMAELTHGLDIEHLIKDVLNSGQSIYLQANEWHGIKNLSSEKELVVHLKHTPMGIMWSQFGREGIALQSAGQLPAGFVKNWFDRLGVEFKATH
jgi:quercetin dioxygenase-like cupin family protein